MSETVAAARLVAAGDRRGDQAWFAWVHLYEPHFPYAPPEPFRSRFSRDPYHGEVAAVDAALGPLLQPILDAGDESDTLVVVTSDHGEALGDHGEATHGMFAYEATLRVPLDPLLSASARLRASSMPPAVTSTSCRQSWSAWGARRRRVCAAAALLRLARRSG